jgi:ketosteroid isomerase-like protein
MSRQFLSLAVTIPLCTGVAIAQTAEKLSSSTPPVAAHDTGAFGRDREQKKQGEANRALVRRTDEALARGQMETVYSLFDEQCVLELPAGHPLGRIYKGLDEVNKARARMKKVLGISHYEVVADAAYGPHMVMLLLNVGGTDAADKPWSMPVMETVEIRNGKIARFRLFFYDTVRLRQIAGGRQAAE